VQFQTFPLLGPLHIRPVRHGDERGYFSEIFRAEAFAAAAGDFAFVQENQSLSARVGTVRGLHFQTAPMAQGKLVRCVAGAIYDVAVDLRHDSPDYGKWIAVELSADAGNQLWVPPGFGHGFCKLMPDSVVCYKVTAYYSPENDAGVRWDDPAIGVEWPDVADAGTLSAKDRVQPLLAELPALFSVKDQY